MKSNDHKKRGFRGWDDGCALRVLSRCKTPYGRVWLCEVVGVDASGKRVREPWLEAKTEMQMLEIGPDCNHDVPAPDLFTVIHPNVS